MSSEPIDPSPPEREPELEPAPEPGMEMDHAEDDAAPAPAKLTVVGVGASAGGLEALQELVKNLEHDSFALVVIQHLAPNHGSSLTQLLARVSGVPVVLVEDGTKLQRNLVYVIAPNTSLTLSGGTLRVSALPVERMHRLPIDTFFRSLAEDQTVLPIGVVLSGTGSDGTLGLQAIKAAGGVTFVQDPVSARYDGMPRSALDSGFADYCLPAAQIAQELLRVSKHPFFSPVRASPHRPAAQLERLFAMVRTAFGHDLAGYKLGTIERRVERRMAIRRVDDFGDYLKLLRDDRSELQELYGDLLIGVTSFFRDRETFDILRSDTFPRLLAERPGGVVRVWVAGCSTGEEVYSIAMTFFEALDGCKQPASLQIFATDVDAEAVQHARGGEYAQNIELDVSPERLQRFFAKRDSTYQIRRSVRDAVVFSVQDLTRDAPFSRLDLVSCRNLLIYLRPALQKKVLRTLHYALNPDGVLLLGKSETVGDSADLFALGDRRAKLYHKKHAALSYARAIPANVPVLRQDGRTPGIPRAGGGLQALADQLVLHRYGPPGVVIAENLDVLQFRGRTGMFLAPAPGVATLNVLRLVRPELHLELRRALEEAVTADGPVVVEARLQEREGLRPVTIEVLPLRGPELRAQCLLVLFRVQERPSSSAGPQLEAPEGETRSRAVDQELQLTRAYLQSTIEELERSNEELRAANEELQSTNEEMQSTNEEMETSKEELQSSNEELTTVNEELQTRMSELAQTNDDLHNLLVGVDNAVVIAGPDQRIRRFTRAAERLFKLLPADVGRPIGYLDGFLGGRTLETLVGQVMEDLQTVRREVRASDGRWYALQVAPYKTLDQAIKGAVVVLANIDLARGSTARLASVESYARQFLSASNHPQLILDGRRRVVWANAAFYRSFERAPEETAGAELASLGGEGWAEPGLLRALERLFAEGAPFEELSTQLTTAGRELAGPQQLRGSLLPALDGAGPMALLTLVSAPAGKA